MHQKPGRSFRPRLNRTRVPGPTDAYGDFIDPETLGFMVESLRDVRERLQVVAWQGDHRQLTVEEVVVVLVRIWGHSAPRLLRLTQRDRKTVFLSTLYGRDCTYEEMSAFLAPAFGREVAKGTISRWLRSASDKLGVRDDGDDRLSPLRLVFLRAFSADLRFPW